MRCISCRVDLPETYLRCPLCGEKAVAEENVIRGIRFDPFPKNSKPEPPIRPVKNKAKGAAERIKAFFRL